MRKTSLIALVLFGALLLYASSGLPGHGDPDGPSHRERSRVGSPVAAAHYIRHAQGDAASPNIVTVVLADSSRLRHAGRDDRGLDRRTGLLPDSQTEPMTSSSRNPILITASRLLAPFIQLFALYVIFHGHFGPGGGFQGGAMLAASILMLRLSVGAERSELKFRKSWGTPVGALGSPDLRRYRSAHPPCWGGASWNITFCRFRT